MKSFLPFLTTMIAVFAGCTPADDQTMDFVGTELARTRVDDLAKTMDFIGSERQFSQKEFQDKVRSGLARWTRNSSSQIDQVDWSLDKNFEPLLKDKNEVAVLMEMDSKDFIDSDSYYLQEVVWLSRITGRLGKLSIGSAELFRLAAGDFKPSKESTDVWTDLFSKLNPSLKRDEAAKLAQSFRIFDWMIRNTNLLPEIDNTKEDLSKLRLNDRVSLAGAGIAGTGYQRFPAQTLILGRGDYLDRAKLFMESLRICGMDSVLLAVTNPQSPNSPTPWVVAVAIGSEYFLFDTALGLPIPGEELGSIATLSMIQNKPELLSNLNLTVEESLEETTKYRVQPEQLKQLSGLIYAPPEAVSKRFKALESQLIGDQRLAFSMSISDVLNRLPNHDGIKIQVWDIGVKTHEFRQAVSEALEDVSNNEIQERLAWYYTNEGYVVEFPRYRTARVRYFQGSFQNEKELLNLNAIESFEMLTYSDEEISSLATDTMLQQKLGILTEDRSKDDFQRRLDSTQGHMRMVRRDTGPFLSLAHFDNGSFGAARNWAKITKQKDAENRWAESLDYLNGRGAESQKDYAVAIEEYRKNPKSLQSQGNLLRARLLQEAVTKVFGNLAAESEKVDSEAKPDK